MSVDVGEVVGEVEVKYMGRMWMWMWKWKKEDVWKETK